MKKYTYIYIYAILLNSSSQMCICHYGFRYKKLKNARGKINRVNFSWLVYNRLWINVCVTFSRRNWKYHGHENACTNDARDVDLKKAQSNSKSRQGKKNKRTRDSLPDHAVTLCCRRFAKNYCEILIFHLFDKTSYADPNGVNHIALRAQTFFCCFNRWPVYV